MDCCQDLASAIVQQAAKEYIRALRHLKKQPNSDKALRDVRKIEKLCHSEWYALLSDVDPDYLINRLRQEETNQ